MEEHLNSFKGQIAPDVVPNLQPEGSARRITNMTMIRFDGTSYAIQNNRGTQLSFSVYEGYSIIGYINTGEYLVIYSTNDSEPYTGGNGEIGIVQIDNDNTVTGYIPLYNHQDWNFSLMYRIGAAYWRDNENKVPTYFWDNLNPPRTFDVANPIYQDHNISPITTLDASYMVLNGVIQYNGIDYGPNEAAGTVVLVTTALGGVYTIISGTPIVIPYVPVETLDLLPKLVTYGDVKYLQRIDGNLFNGVYFYFYQLETAEGGRTPWSVGTRPIHLTEGAVVDNDDESYLEYQGMGGLDPTGTQDDSTLDTGRGIRFQINNIDTNYTSIRVAYCQGTWLDISGNYFVIASQTITGTSMTFDHTDMLGSEELLAEDILFATDGILANRTGDIARNTLFLGNILQRHLIGWTPSETVTTDSIMREVPHDTMDYEYGPGSNNHPLAPANSSAANPMYGHVVGREKVGTLQIIHNQWYIVEGTTGTLDDGTNPPWAIGDIFLNTLVAAYTTYTQVGVGADVIAVPIIPIRKYGTGSITANPEQFDIHIIRDEWLDNKGMMVNHVLQSHWRSETYRYAIVLIDQWGNPYYAHHLADHQMPGYFDASVNVHTNADVASASSEPMVTKDDATFWIHYMRHLGVRFSNIEFQLLVDDINTRNGTNYAVADLPILFKGFMIVRADRDKQIQAQGLVYPIQKIKVGEQSTLNNGSLLIEGEEFLTQWSGDMLLNTSFLPDVTDPDTSTLSAGNKITLRVNPSDVDCYLYHILYQNTYTPSPLYEWEREKNHYSFFSPDFLLNFGHDLPQIAANSELHTVAIMGDVSRPSSEILGTIHTQLQGFYSKFTEYNSTLLGTTDAGATTNLRVEYCQPIESSEREATVGANNLRFNNIGHYRHTAIGVLGGGESFTGSGFAKGALTYLLVTDADEDSTGVWHRHGMSAVNTNAAVFKPATADHHKHLVNIVTPKATLYGGTSESAKESTIYYPIGHYQAFDDDFMTYLNVNADIVDNIEIFGGDCFLSMFDYTRMLANGIDNYGTPNANNQKLIPFENGNTGTELQKYNHTIVFPVESNVNIGLREGFHAAKDRTIGSTGVGMGTPNAGNPINLEGVGASSIFGNPETLLYNDAYSSQKNAVTLVALSSQDLISNRYPTRYIWTGEKGINEGLDIFRAFPAANLQDLPGVGGELVALIAKGQRLFYWQDNDLGFISIQERAMIPNILGQAVTLGEGEVADTFQKTNETFGSQHQWGIVAFDQGFLWIDGRRKALLKMDIGGSNAEIGVKMLSQSLLNNLVGDGFFFDQHLIGKGLEGGFDDHVNKGFISLLGVKENGVTADFVLSYDIDQDMISGTFSYRPVLFIEGNNRLFSPVNYNLSTFISPIANLTDYTAYQSFVKEGNNIYICILSYTSLNPATIPSADPTYWTSIGGANQVHEHNVGDMDKYYGLVHKAILQFVVNPMHIKAKIFDNFTFAGTGGDFFTAVLVDTLTQTGGDRNLDAIPSLEYENRDDVYLSNTPLANRGDRMTGEYLIVTLEKDNALYVNGTRNILVSNNSLVRLVGVTTIFRRAY